MKYSDKAYRELYSLAGLLEKFNDDLKREEIAPWHQEDKDRITENIGEWSCILKFYAKELNDLEFIKDIAD